MDLSKRMLIDKKNGEGVIGGVENVWQLRARPPTSTC